MSDAFNIVYVYFEKNNVCKKWTNNNIYNIDLVIIILYLKSKIPCIYVTINTVFRTVNIINYK